MYNEDYLRHYAMMQDYLYSAGNPHRNDHYLAHYGVPGMRWGQHLFGKISGIKSARKSIKDTASGKRLTSRSKSLASRVKRRMAIQQGKKIADAEKTLGIRDENGAKLSKDKQKSKVLKSRSAKELYKHADLFSDEELDKAYKRLSLEKRIKDLESNEQRSSKVDKWINATQKAASLSNNAQQIAGNGIKFYNYMVDINNSVNNGSLKKIGNGKGDKQKDDDD